MAQEVKLKPGWLLRDVRNAAARLEPSHSNRSTHRTDDSTPAKGAQRPDGRSDSKKGDEKIRHQQHRSVLTS
jgi:hypothetical protein